MTSSRLNAQLSFPTSKRLTVIICGAARAAPELASNNMVRTIFFMILPVNSIRFPGGKQTDGQQRQRAEPYFSLRGSQDQAFRPRTACRHARYLFTNAITTIPATSAHLINNMRPHGDAPINPPWINSALSAPLAIVPATARCP